MSFGALAFTPLVKKLQERYGSRRQYERMEKSLEPQDTLTTFEEEYLADRDTFYMRQREQRDGPTFNIGAAPKDFCGLLITAQWPLRIFAATSSTSALEIC
jgi:hypothetical protein